MEPESTMRVALQTIRVPVPPAGALQASARDDVRDGGFPSAPCSRPKPMMIESPFADASSFPPPERYLGAAAPMALAR